MSTESHEHEQQPPHDELDAMLRVWHDVNAERAAAGREALMLRLRAEREGASISLSLGQERSNDSQRAAEGEGRGEGARVIASRRFLSTPFLRAAASLALLITAIALLIPFNSKPAQARQQVILQPEGGRLEALDDHRQVIGPCPLQHTDVKVDIAGPFSRVTVKQQYHNPYPGKIEAVYTFPLSHRAAVDRMTMTIGDRVIEGEVKERQQARQIYESARNAGHVASLLEQERPNIFTQSIANLERNADVVIEISYIEMLQQRDGEYTFDFPMVVAPRYIPGCALNSAANAEMRGWDFILPNELEKRNGALLLGPASFERMKIDMTGLPGQPDFTTTKKPWDGDRPTGGWSPYLQRIIDAATPILSPDPAYRQRADVQTLYHTNPQFDFDVIYADGTREFGQIAGDGLGHINGRWFYFDPAIFQQIAHDEANGVGMIAGAEFHKNTDQVPDASRITPMPVRPPLRAGHDISLSVSIDTGGPGIVDYKSDLHEIVCTDGPRHGNLGNKVNLALKDQKEIPNRDFVLHWRCLDDSIQEAVFTHADPKWIEGIGGPGVSPGRVTDQNQAPANQAKRETRTGETPVPPDQVGGFFTLIIAPPKTVDDAATLPRELIFVLDTSGSMSGEPIEKAKAVMSRTIDSMRPGDTFNMITFSGDTRILWKAPRVNSEVNRAEAQAFLAAQNGAGGTEMMTAINAALTPTAEIDAKAQATLTPAQLADLPADGREVVVRTHLDDSEATVRKSAVMQPKLRVRPDLALTTSSFHFPVEKMFGNPVIDLHGKWATVNGERILQVANADAASPPQPDSSPLRIVMFLTDGQVGNDDAIISAVREHAATTRVFSFGIGDSPNRYLLDGIAQAGRGEAAYVNLANNPDAAVQRFVRRISAPVLRDIHLAFSEGMQIADTVPNLDAVPDLWDVKLLIVHGRYSIGNDVAGAKPTSGKVTIRGTTARGGYERVIDITLPARDESHAMLPALWARAQVDQILANDDQMKRNGGMVANASADSRDAIIALGERYHIASAFTSFVAVEKARLIIAGRSVLVPVPIELPEGTRWEGFFGGENRKRDDARLSALQGLNIDELLALVRRLQLELKFNEALQVIDQILRLDPLNPSALALRDVITTTTLYRNYMQSEKMHELGYGQLRATDNVRSMIVPGVAGPAPKSTGGLMEYPVDWPQLSPAKTRGLTPTDAALAGQGVLSAPLLSDIPLVGDAFTANTHSPDSDALYSTITGQFSTAGLTIDQHLDTVDPSTGADRLHSASIMADYYSLAARSGFAPIVVPASDAALIDQLAMLDAGEIASGDRKPAADGVWGEPVAPSPPPPPPSPSSGTVNFAWQAAQTQPNFNGAPGLNLNEALEQSRGEKQILQSASEGARLTKEAKKQSERQEWEARQRQVAESLKRVRELADERKVDEALQVIDEVLFIDEHNADAIALRNRLTTQRSPDLWRERLAIHLPIDFRNNSLEQIFAYFQACSGLDIFVDWEALQMIGVHRTDIITMKLQDVEFGPALRQVLDAVGKDLHPAFTGKDALLLISAPEAIAKGFDAGADAAEKARNAERTKALAEFKRQDRLHRVIDQRLWAAVFGDASEQKPRHKAVPPPPLGIVVLVSDAKDAAALAQMKSLGLRIDDTNAKMNLVAGTIDDAAKLVDLALLECVRRIEPIDVTTVAAK